MANLREHPLSKWFGDKKYVRLMLLAALLTLGVIHVQSLIQGFFFLWGIAHPLIVGAAIAYILEIVVKLLEKLLFPNSKQLWLVRSRRWVCIGLSFLLVLSIVVLLVAIVIPGLGEAVALLARELPVYTTQLKDWLLTTFRDVPTVTEYVSSLDLDWVSIQDRLVNWAVNGVADTKLLSSTVSVISAVTGHLANFMISIIFALFLLGSKEKLHHQFSMLTQATLTDKTRNRLQHFLSTANRCFSGFIVGQTTNGLILGFLTWLGMRIFGMPYALVIGVLSGTTSLIPIVGGYIGAVLGTFLVFTANPGLAPWFLLFIVALQTISGNTIYPRLLGTSVGIPSLWVLAAITVGGGIGGVGGMLIAVPVTATLYALIQEWVKKKNAAKPAAEPL